MYSSKWFILAAMLNSVLKNCNLRDAVFTRPAAVDRTLSTGGSAAVWFLLTKVVNKTVKLERRLSGLQ